MEDFNRTKETSVKVKGTVSKFCVLVFVYITCRYLEPFDDPCFD